MGRIVAPRLLRAGMAAMVVLAGWAGFELHSLLRSVRPAGAPVAVGEASVPTPIADLDPLQRLPEKIPERLPEFALADATGKRISIHTWDGHSLILNFWATWCEPCRREIPLLESLERRFPGVKVVGVAVDERAAVLDYARAMKIDYPLLIGEEDALDVAARLGFESPAFPFTVFTDRRGQVVALFLGELHPAQAALILGEVELLNADREGLEQARHSISAGLRALATPQG